MQKVTDNSNQQPQRGFTLAELLVVLAVLGFLAVTLLPALAATKHNSKLIQCQSNLRQIGAACAMYANDFKGWYPITTFGANAGVNNYPGSVNHIVGIHYTHYLYLSDSGQDGVVMPRFIQPSISSQRGFQDQNLGYLYADGLISDGHTLYCPSFNQITDHNSPLYALGADYYSKPQFMCTHTSGAIRSSYLFNPRLVNAYGYPTSSDVLRRYQKTSDVKSRDVFTVDYLTQASMGLTTFGPGVPFNPDNWAHWPSKGLNALFTDGSAKFCEFNSFYFNAIVKYLDSDENKTSAVEYDQIFDALRDSP